MPYGESYFELHAGFPDDAVSRAGADQFLNENARLGWTRSVVSAVFIKNPGCVDPHNVPGTLESLISRQVFRSDELSWPTTIRRFALPLVESALRDLGEAGATNARLEIECPFGWLAASEDASGSELVERAVFDPIRIPASELQFSSGVRMADVPEWEIHFVVEPRSIEHAQPTTMQDVPPIIEQHGVDIEQTIQYRSQAMLAAGANHYKYISTAYYPDPEAVVSEARRLFDHSNLVEDFWSRGYRLTLILEHIVGCFQPALKASAVQNVLSHSR
jgi:hypothetical protein